MEMIYRQCRKDSGYYLEQKDEQTIKARVLREVHYWCHDLHNQDHGRLLVKQG